MHSDTHPREAIGKYKTWQLGKNGNWQEWQLANLKRQGKRILGKLAECNNRESAESLIGFDIAIGAEQLDSLRSDQYYWVDLIGLDVVDTSGTAFGKIERVFDTGANDVIVVQGERERLIPWSMGDVITSVDLDAGVVEVSWDADF